MRFRLYGRFCPLFYKSNKKRVNDHEEDIAVGVVVCVGVECGGGSFLDEDGYAVAYAVLVICYAV